MPRKKPEPKRPAKPRPLSAPESKPGRSAHDMPELASLTPKQREFVEQYLIDLNATQAAIRAGYSVRTADAIGGENLGKPAIQVAIAARRAEMVRATGLTPERVVEDLARVAFADARELVEVKVGCCRHCHGYGHGYQRTVGEMNADREMFLARGGNPEEFDEAGGIGFDMLLPPNPACPQCGGDGLARTVLKDTRNLSPAAAVLYAGAKQTKDGIEIRMHSKLDAAEKLMRHLGLYEKDNSQKPPELIGKVLLVPLQPNDSPEAGGTGSNNEKDD